LNYDLVTERKDDYESYVKQKLRYIRYLCNEKRAIRKDAVGSIELVVRANGIFLDVPNQSAQNFNVDEWAKDTFQWADRIFNPPNHHIETKVYVRYLHQPGKKFQVQNIYSAVVHLDESTPHMHIMILPIDEKGRLNSSAYRSRELFCKLQDTYYEEVGKKHGLERGVKYSPAKAVDIQRFHEYINEIAAQEAPPHIPGETMMEYDERVTEELQRCHAHMRQQDLEHEKEKNHLIAQHRNYRTKVQKTVIKINEDLFDKKEKFIVRSEVLEIRKDADAMRDIKEAMKNYPDQEYSHRLAHAINRIVMWNKEREKELEMREYDDYDGYER